MLVIVWGAYVRATGSGAGCGSDWPLCRGEVVPRSPAPDTVVEFVHRVSSGLVGLLAIALVVAAFRSTDRGHRARGAALWTVAFMALEAAIGAGLVLFELVADNASTARALWMGAHLVNTFLLLGALVLTVHYADGGARLRWRHRGWTSGALALGAVGLLLVGASGAVAALGDTLFRADTLEAALRQDLSPTAHVLVRLRALHPLVAVAVGLYLLALPPWLRKRGVEERSRRFGSLVALLVLLQIGVGSVNILLMAPIWLQLVHLLVADLLWIAFVALATSVLAATPATGGSVVP